MAAGRQTKVFVIATSDGPSNCLASSSAKLEFLKGWDGSERERMQIEVLLSTNFSCGGQRRARNWLTSSRRKGRRKRMIKGRRINNCHGSSNEWDEKRWRLRTASRRTLGRHMYIYRVGQRKERYERGGERKHGVPRRENSRLLIGNDKMER